MTGTSGQAGPGFRHVLYPYDGQHAFVAGALAYIEEALRGGAVVLLAVDEPKEELLRAELPGSGAAGRVTFLDTATVGRNPGRMIPAWQAWIAERSADGSPVHAIGESRWSGRTEGETAELRYHEWLLNMAFARSPMWWLLCPYDTTTFGEEELALARRCHPLVLRDGLPEEGPDYGEEPFAFDALPAPQDGGNELTFGFGDLPAVREAVTSCAARHGMKGARLRELLIVCTEVASNSLRYGGGGGTLRMWGEEAAGGTVMICEFHDSGYLSDPLVGRIRPRPDQLGGRGMWLVQQLCDLVQIRSDPGTGTTVRLHMAVD
ncbi:anti-sigma factor RsbA family regulatory protein [Streptomyces sp. NBC_01190]|uniref:anti-sigma factor RsbA family regulatory protein n=1 Tax=Streptomyces sp. NBC_01190 TaxID=2903767 RepID=UPI003869D421|nr:sensor histidine kinase [Streptomyces sp. NBC_01190]